MDIKSLTFMVNSMMGNQVLTEEQMAQLMQGAKKAKETGGINAVVDYLLKVTKADVNPKELKNFAKSIKDDPLSALNKLKNN